MKSFLILAMLAGGLVFGFNVKMAGAQAVPAAQNPLCWEKSACEAIFKQNGWTFNEQLHWLSGGAEGECNDGDRGACIPASKAQMSIAVGGTNLVNNFGDYIKKIYIYLISIGGLIAAILVIKGGFEYITSTGNSQRIEGAKETIRNALLGLVLLLGSYTILYTINPDLLKLKLPRTFMVREIALPSRWCLDQPKNSLLALGKKGVQEIKKKENLVEADYTVKRVDSECGSSYFVSGGNNTCAGNLCQLNSGGKYQVCVPGVNNQSDECKEGILSGSISGSGIKFPFVDNNLALERICFEGGVLRFNQIASIDVPRDDSQKNKQSYVFTNTTDDLKKGCQNIYGFFFRAEINDDNGIDDEYPVGCSSSGGVCDVNLKLKFSIADAPNGDYDRDVKPFLIPAENLNQPVVYDISLSRQNFPAE